MALYKYIKKYPKRKSKLIHYLSFVSISIGAFLLFWGIWPIMSFNFFTSSLFSKTVSPINEESLGRSNQSNIAVLAASQDNQEENINRPDYTNPNIWFPKRPQERSPSKAVDYDFSLPTFKIYDAKVINKLPLYVRMFLNYD